MKGYAVTGHRMGAVAVQELEHVLAVNAGRWARGEEPYYVLAVRDTLPDAIAAEKKLRALKGSGAEKQSHQDTKAQGAEAEAAIGSEKQSHQDTKAPSGNGPALMALGLALAVARANFKEAEAHGKPQEAAQWRGQVESLEASVRKMWEERDEG